MAVELGPNVKAAAEGSLISGRCPVGAFRAAHRAVAWPAQ
jgi:hypothetical protein